MDTRNFKLRNLIKSNFSTDIIVNYVGAIMLVLDLQSSQFQWYAYSSVLEILKLELIKI